MYKDRHKALSDLTADKPNKIKLFFKNFLIALKVYFLYRHLKNYIRYRVWDEYMFNWLSFEINSMCNRKCEHCPNFRHSRPYGFMPEEIFKKCIDEISKINYNGFIFYNFYSEPLLDKRLASFVMYAKQKCPCAKNVIFTNGDFLTRPLFKKLITAGVDLFIISQYDNYITKNITEILQKSTEQEKNKICIELKKDLRFHNRGGLCPGYGVEINKHSKCLRPTFELIITFNGNVLPCCNDYFEKYILGNVREMNLLKIWVLPKSKKFRRDLAAGYRQKYELCKNCNAW